MVKRDKGILWPADLARLVPCPYRFLPAHELNPVGRAYLPCPPAVRPVELFRAGVTNVVGFCLCSLPGRPQPLARFPRFLLELHERIGVFYIRRYSHHLGITIQQKPGIVHLDPHFFLGSGGRQLQSVVSQQAAVLVPLLDVELQPNLLSGKLPFSVRFCFLPVRLLLDAQPRVGYFRSVHSDQPDLLFPAIDVLCNGVAINYAGDFCLNCFYRLTYNRFGQLSRRTYQHGLPAFIPTHFVAESFGYKTHR